MDFIQEMMDNILNFSLPDFLLKQINAALQIVGNVFKSIIPTCLYAEKELSQIFGKGSGDALFKVFLSVGIMLIVIKFVKKGLDIYVLYQDGDPETDPLGLLASFFKALAMAFSFPAVYDIVARLTTEFTNLILKNTTLDSITASSISIVNMVGAGFVEIIMAIIFVVLMFNLYIQFLVRGLEVLILKLAFPLACVGILDSDNGVYASFIKKFTQTMFSIIAQISLSFAAIVMAASGNMFWAIACCTLALKTPEFLSEFMVGGMGGAVNKSIGLANSGIRLGQSLKSIRTIAGK